MNWQPIETAPKDGTWFLSYTHPWNADSQWSPFEVTRYQDHYEGRFEDSSRNAIDPTHWMPLPEFAAND